MHGENRATAVILFAHGSPVEKANQGIHELASQVRALGGYSFVRAAFLDCAHPDLGEAISEAIESGARRVVVIPYFLTMGLHLRRDLPNLIAPLRKKHPQFQIEVGKSLEGHPLMTSIILERVAETLETTEARA